MRHTVVDSVIGPLTLVLDDGGALTGVFMGGHRPAPRPERLGPRVDGEGFETVVAQLEEYLDGRRHTFDLVTRASGTPFQQEVWAALARVPYGATTTYGALARSIGRPSAARPVGAAVGRNPLSLVVPCHRVIGTDGTLTGYAGGLERKTYLLALEHRQVPSLAPAAPDSAHPTFTPSR
ncbi:MAG: methylated-DNA--[protein]-cysteine S-methyltransferase [Actinobacteria bacterium]|nr:methylated-DNA--[protein]-cysteine S-methyltransferase [Actinomycetota bacterium]